MIEVESFATDFDQRLTPRRRASLLTVSDFARLANVSRKTVHRWIAAGKLGASKLGGCWRIAPHALISDFPAVYEAYMTDIGEHVGSSVKIDSHA